MSKSEKRDKKIQKIMSERFKSLRKEKNLTQEELVDEFYLKGFKTTVQSMGHWEKDPSDKNYHEPMNAAIEMYAKHFGVSMDWLTGKSPDRTDADRRKRLIEEEAERRQAEIDYVAEMMISHKDYMYETEEAIQDLLDRLGFVTTFLNEDKSAPINQLEKYCVIRNLEEGSVELSYYKYKELVGYVRRFVNGFVPLFLVRNKEYEYLVTPKAQADKPKADNRLSLEEYEINESSSDSDAVFTLKPKSISKKGGNKNGKNAKRKKNG